MRHRAIVSLVLFALISTAAMAEEKAPQAPKPGPEHKKLSYFVGKWNFEGDMKEGPFGPAGKMTGADSWEWFPGGFFLVGHSTGNGPMGTMKGLSTLGYDAETKSYTYHAIDSMGMAESSTGKLENGTWTWQSEHTMKGKVMKMRYTIKEGTPTEYTFKGEMSDDGTNWKPMMDGTEKKAVAKKETK